MIGVFGGSGFIGKNLLDQLSREKLQFLNFDRELAKGFEDQSIIIDYSEPDSYSAHLSKLSKIIMLISASVPNTFSHDISLEIEKNIVPFSKFIKVLSQHSNIDKIVYLSSGGTVYGIPITDPIHEDHPTRPINNYGCGKLLMENLLISAAHQYEWEYAILRPSNPIGRYQRPGGQGLVAVAVECALKGKTLTIWGDGAIVRDYFDVRDLANAIQLSLNTSIGSNIFNVGSNIGRSIIDIVNIVSSTLEKDIRLEHVKARPVDIPKNILSYQKLNQICGWKPIRSLQESIIDITENL